MKTGLSFLAAAVLSAFGGATSTPVQPAALAPTSCVTITRALTVGSRGDDVKKLQQVLGVEQTGYFGAMTKQKLVAWQISKKIVLTAKAEGAGTTGPKTRAALKCVALPVPTASSVVTSVATATATTSTATATSSTPSVLPSAGGSGGGGGIIVPSVSPYGYICTQPGDQPPASSCTDGTWQLSLDEAACITWACISNDDRG